MTALEIHQFPCLADNYGVLIHDAGTGATASIDAPDAAVILRQLAEKGWRLTHILTTHHHDDHTAGNLELKSRTGCAVVGPRAEAEKIPGLDTAADDGEVLAFGGAKIHVLGTPGHTAGHAAYWIPSVGAVFTGDALFGLGCGRLFEGTAETMWNSLQKLAALPPETLIYCGHEYGAANARFALTVEPGNAALQERARDVAAGAPSSPAPLALERETNPFLRAGSPEIRERLGMANAPDWRVFAELRDRKNKSR